MWRLNDLFGVNQAHPAERLACVAFDNIEKVIGDTPAMLQHNRERWNQFVASRDDLDCAPAVHGITAFARWSGGNTERLNEHLRERYDTAVVPGRWFGMPDYFRVGFGLGNPDFEEALNRLGAALDDLK
jgi:aspartate/methionine/tyrosine aminotransferase